MDSKKVIEKLAGIVAKQQKIIEKLAQAVQLPGSGDPVLSGGKDPTPPVHPAAPQNFQPKTPNLRDADIILAALPPAVKPAVAKLEVHDNDILVRFHSNKDSDQAFNTVIQTVHSLQAANKLSGHTYQVKQVA
jgi:hypothetical protein